MENNTVKELAEKCFELISNEHIDIQRLILEMLKTQIEDNWENMNESAMEDFSFGI